MNHFQQFQNFFSTLPFPILLTVGLVILLGFYLGKVARLIKLPSLIGFMIVGALLGPSLFNLLNVKIQNNLSFITDICLGFVALSIGIELRFTTLKQQGWGMMLIIFMESFMAFIFVTLFIWLVTKDLAMALILGSIAPASAPAGTVAVIQEFKAKGPLTQALYTVVGFDDGLGIVIFGFASAFAKSVIMNEAGFANQSAWVVLLQPLKEIGLSVLVGIALSFIFKLITFKLKGAEDIFIIAFAIVIIGAGVSSFLNLSLILTNLIIGMAIVNSTSPLFINKVTNKIADIMPLLFVLFFILAGANLHIKALPQMGLVGVIYILGRTSGLMGGAWFGSLLGKAEPVIRKYLGLGILSQAGVAIGLSLVVKKDFLTLFEGKNLESMNPQQAAAFNHANTIGTAVITMITATCIFFEILGPITTRIALKKANEIHR